MGLQLYSLKHIGARITISIFKSVTLHLLGHQRREFIDLFFILDSALMNLKDFIAQIGTTTAIFSDNSMNFVGENRELRASKSRTFMYVSSRPKDSEAITLLHYIFGM